MKRKQMENVREEERSVVASVDKSITEKMSVSSTGQAAMKHRDTGKFIGGVHNKTDNITSVKSIITSRCLKSKMTLQSSSEHPGSQTSRQKAILIASLLR